MQKKVMQVLFCDLHSAVVLADNVWSSRQNYRPCVMVHRFCRATQPCPQKSADFVVRLTKASVLHSWRQIAAYYISTWLTHFLVLCLFHFSNRDICVCSVQSGKWRVIQRRQQQYAETASLWYISIASVSEHICWLYQIGHKPGKPGILGEFSEAGKLREFSWNSVQPQGKIVTNVTRCTFQCAKML